MQVAQFPGGHSNLTYHVRFGTTELVVRRPPFGPVPPTAHDMAREYRWLSAVHHVFPLAPRAYAFCDDPVDRRFAFLRDGTATGNRHPRRGAATDQRTRWGFGGESAWQRSTRWPTSTPSTLPRLVFRISANRTGSSSARCAAGANGWNRSKTSDVPDMEALARWLGDSLPPNPARPTIVHGDFKLDNLMLDAARPVPSGCGVRLGDGGARRSARRSRDSSGVLGRERTGRQRPRDSLATVTTLPGWLTPSELVERYAARSGRDLTTLRFFEVFALFKIAVVIQQIYYRFRAWSERRSTVRSLRRSCDVSGRACGLADLARPDMVDRASQRPAARKMHQDRRVSSVRFIDPMLLLRTDALPSGNQWLYQLKLDGYRAIAFKTRRQTCTCARATTTTSATRYPAVVKALAKLPDETVIDGESRRVRRGRAGRPSARCRTSRRARRRSCTTSST